MNFKIKFIIGLLSCLFALFSCSLFDNDTKRLTSVRSEAKVEKVEELSVDTGGNPKVRLHLEVMPEDDASFKTVVEKTVHKNGVPKAGDYVTVFYNLNDKSDVVVDLR